MDLEFRRLHAKVRSAYAATECRKQVLSQKFEKQNFLKAYFDVFSHAIFLDVLKRQMLMCSEYFAIQRLALCAEDNLNGVLRD